MPPVPSTCSTASSPIWKADTTALSVVPVPIRLLSGNTGETIEQAC